MAKKVVTPPTLRIEPGGVYLATVKFRTNGHFDNYYEPCLALNGEQLEFYTGWVITDRQYGPYCNEWAMLLLRKPHRLRHINFPPWLASGDLTDLRLLTRGLGSYVLKSRK